MAFLIVWAEIYVPAVARFPGDLENRYRLLEPARERGFKTGLMLVLRDQRDLEPEAIERQLGNLEPYVGLPEAERPAVFIIHPNKPITGPQRLNFLDNPEYSQGYVEQGIELVGNLPKELTPATGAVLSFHLNTLIPPVKWHDNPYYWQRKFEDVSINLRKLAEFASGRNVQLSLETTPVPEFGDMKKDRDTFIYDENIYWADLVNPWPLFFWREEIKKIRQLGLKLKIDFCHSYIAMSAVSLVSNLPRPEQFDGMISQGISEQDLKYANETQRFTSLVLSNTETGSIWDANDARGLYRTPELHGVQSYFEEGVTLFEGDIPAPHLQHLIKEGVNMPIKIVLEINETNFEDSPNTKTSLQRVLELV